LIDYRVGAFENWVKRLKRLRSGDVAVFFGKALVDELM
jgi:hypothetical protein